MVCTETIRNIPVMHAVRMNVRIHRAERKRKVSDAELIKGQNVDVQDELRTMKGNVLRHEHDPTICAPRGSSSFGSIEYNLYVYMYSTWCKYKYIVVNMWVCRHMYSVYFLVVSQIECSSRQFQHFTSSASSY